MSDELLLDPDFELDNGAWTEAGSANIQAQANAQSGANVMAFRSQRGVGDPVTSTATQSAITVTSGAAYTIDLWWRHTLSGGASHVLEIRLDSGDGVYDVLEQISGSEPIDLWNHRIFEFTADGTEAKLQFHAEGIEPLTIGTSRWWVDNCSLKADDVAIKLAERGVDAMVSTLQTNLVTELGAIDTERGDGITMAVPASGDYFKYPRAELAGKGPFVEVFEDAWDFDITSVDADDQKTEYVLPVTVRITYFNRDTDTADTMIIRMRRYAAAVAIVLLKNTNLVGNDDGVVIADLNRVENYWDVEGQTEDKRMKVGVTLRCQIACGEVV